MMFKFQNRLKIMFYLIKKYDLAYRAIKHYLKKIEWSAQFHFDRKGPLECTPENHQLFDIFDFQSKQKSQNIL